VRCGSAVITLFLLALAGGASPLLGAGPWQNDPEPASSFAAWLEGVRTDALARGIRPEIVDQALADVTEPLPVVIERDRTQAEVILPLEAYLAQRVTPRLVGTGRDMLSRHRTILAKVSEAYGVPAPVIVSIWGLESNFGRFTGVRPTIAALATLAWDPRRTAFFREELLKALEILNGGDVDLASMQGSWAGAMGQPQFMPSSYLQYAVDFDGDGRRDIWRSHADVFASVANYLKSHGWVPGYRWGRSVAVSSEVRGRAAAIERREGTCSARRDMTARRPLKEWHNLCIRLPGGHALPAAPLDASLVSGATRHFLVYDNYDVLLAYNCAHAYALSVALLSERIG
jgi:membrane-bound lytic murein transglycosylase B